MAGAEREGLAVDARVGQRLIQATPLDCNNSYPEHYNTGNELIRRFLGFGV